MKKVLVLVGPTAVGKTKFSIELAKRFNGEIISGDSIQVYRGFDIGSGKVSEDEMDNIPHYCIDILNPTDNYSVADFQENARLKIEEITLNNHLPMIVGGTGLYIKACIYDYTFEKQPDEYPELIQKYENLSNEELVEYLNTFDPEQANTIHQNNRKRLIRACLIYDTSKITKSDIIASQEHKPVYDAFIVGCTLPRENLYQRINQRVLGMIDAGLEDEIKSLLEQGVTFDNQAMQGIGYREWAPYIKRQCTLDEVISEIQKHSRQFAKRQYTWFNNQTPIHWVSMDDEDSINKTVELIEKWSKSSE
ncbi:tRNA (adenosine(37)-N6)-dimethylallyltransferase MiaA [Anaerorhabdus sp.]|jgi:tRNA dimethylallyltransferase|uniref:tRNA (adenosine(37)-N6)-dimethylallyltransferase MiaA n=1 Tax=Anaerorhabdus sp. TaxID=1872524 RepID=UPI002FCB45AE